MQRLLVSAQNYAAVANGDNLWNNLIALGKGKRIKGSSPIPALSAG